MLPCSHRRGALGGADDDDGVAKIMYGVLYAISPEIFPAKDRGTGNGLTATATRLFAILVRKIPLHAFQFLQVSTFSDLPIAELRPILTPPFVFLVANHRTVCESGNCSPGICKWGLDLVGWGVGFGLAFRTPREGLPLDKVASPTLLLVSVEYR